MIGRKLRKCELGQVEAKRSVHWPPAGRAGDAFESNILGFGSHEAS